MQGFDRWIKALMVWLGWMTLFFGTPIRLPENGRWWIERQKKVIAQTNQINANKPPWRLSPAW